MRLRIHHRLFAGFFGLIGLMCVLTVGLVGPGLRRELVADYQEDLGRHLALAEWILVSAAPADPDSLAREITGRVGFRTSLISEAGVVLGDSGVEPDRIAEVENHADRPEVRGALSGRLTFAERTSATVSAPLLYGAHAVTVDGAPMVLRMAAPLDDIDGSVARVQRAVAVSGLLAMLVALVIAYLASRALGQPIVNMAASARRMAEGDLEERAPTRPRVYELDELGAAFNKLTDELRSRLAELGRERDEAQALIDCMAEGVIALTADARVLRTNRAAGIVLGLPASRPHAHDGKPVRDLVEHPALRAVLEESVSGPVSAREVNVGRRRLLVSSRSLDGGGSVTTLLDVSELRRLEQVRSDFVANASHELKTPLTSIRGFAETLLDADPPEDLRLGFLTSIRDNTLRLQRLVDDLLDLSRLESGAWVAGHEPLPLEGVVAEAWQGYAAAAEEKGVRLVVGESTTVLADPDGLHQIFRNLLENALRHTDHGGTIRVTAAPIDGDLVQVVVSDDGEGIPSAALPRIFERFYRADGSRARDFGGTGLGLSIVRHLVGAMGGEISAESALDTGTTITFTLPGAGRLDRSTPDIDAREPGLAGVHSLHTTTEEIR